MILILSTNHQQFMGRLKAFLLLPFHSDAAMAVKLKSHCTLTPLACGILADQLAKVVVCSQYQQETASQQPMHHSQSMVCELAYFVLFK